jgi:protein-tyrosine phosphatase
MPFFNNADEVLPGLWLGNRGAAKDREFLARAKIHAVFNFSKDLPFEEGVERKYRIPVDDNLHPEEIRNLELWAPQFTDRMLQEWNRGPILVHCAAGMQRSAAAVAMFLIRWTSVAPSEAIHYVQLKRPIAFRPVANFKVAIQGFWTHMQQEAYRSAINSDA